MHEQSIVQSLMSIALEHAKQNDASKITRINVVLGELSGVVEESANFYFGFLRQGTMADGAVLSFRHVAITLHCRSCDSNYSVENRDYLCPACRQQGEIIGGREMYVESIEVV